MRETCSKAEIQYVAIGFALSMIHWTLCFVYFALLLSFLNQGVIGCMKGLLIVTARGILSTGVSAAFNSLVSYEKFALIFIFSLYILFNSRGYWISSAVSNVKRIVTIFTIYNIMTAFFTSSYPTVAAFKSISYAIPFCAVITGVSCTNEEVDWIDYINDLLTPIIILSIVLLPIPSRSRIVNTDFQGAINHPNLFGIFASLYIGITLYNMSKHPERGGFIKTGLVAATFYMTYLSASRTGMFSAVVMLGIFVVTQSGKARNRMLGFLAICIVAMFVLSVVDSSSFGNISSSITDFIYKRETDDIWASRQDLMDVSKLKFQANQLMGSGFSVPYSPYIRSSEFSLSLTYEAGNIWWAVLGDCGIIGAILFWGYLAYIFVNTKREKWSLFFYPIVLSMGEMAFFATNNIAIIYFVFYGICLASDDNGSLEEDYEV